MIPTVLGVIYSLEFHKVYLGVTLVNIFLIDLFLIVKDVNIASYADDITLYDSHDTIEEIILLLQSSSQKPFQWLSDNQMKGNTKE